MVEQPILRERVLVDGIVILNLACGHNIHTSHHEMGTRIRTNSLVWPCQFCRQEQITAAPPKIARHLKTATQLWKEAGEP